MNRKSGLGFLRCLAEWRSSERGNVGPLLAIMIVPIIGAFAIGGETSSWYYHHRREQNAADSSVIAAALKGSSGYVTEARTVAAKYGFTNGSNNIGVTPATVTCPAGASVVPGTTCYQVIITRPVPVYLTRVVGYRGDTTISGSPAKTIRASAIAGTVYGDVSYCLRASQDITLNGGSGINHPDLTGCSMLAGGDLKCNGNQPDYGVVRGDAAGRNGTPGGSNTCGNEAHSNQTIPSDPLATQVSNALSRMSTGSCTATNSITSITQGAVNCFTPLTAGGSIALGNSIDVTGQGTVLVIKNGGLSLGANTLQTVQTGPGTYGSMTLVFQGTTQTSVITSSGGALNIGAPGPGSDWSGIAIAEDPSFVGQTVNGGGHTSTCVSASNNTCPQDLNFTGNTPHLYITGAIYAPNASVNIGGSIDKATAPFPYCIAIDAMYITTSGNLTIFNDTTNNPPTSNCRQAGLSFNNLPIVALLQ